eukprot:15629466-Heterocapsa_arctica.AAC.1
MVCHMGPGVQYHTQQLVWAIGNETMRAGGYNPYVGNAEVDTPFLSAQEVVRGLSVERFCVEESWSAGGDENLIAVDKHFFLGFAC